MISLPEWAALMVLKVTGALVSVFLALELGTDDAIAAIIGVGGGGSFLWKIISDHRANERERETMHELVIALRVERDEARAEANGLRVRVAAVETRLAVLQATHGIITDDGRPS